MNILYTPRMRRAGGRSTLETPRLRVELAYRHLKTLILTAKLRPGCLLNEQDIAAQLSISRTPVREALRQLEQEGHLTRHPNRGSMVAHLSIRTVMEIWQLREILEPAGCRMASGQIDPVALAGIEKKMLELNTQPAKLEDYDEHHQADIALHRLIHEATGNKSFVQLIETLTDRIARVRMINRPGRLRLSVAEHLKIISALRQGDPEAAAEAMREHLANARENLVSALPGDWS
jgi:DNA-binding GntR family transcriptional regulator